MSALKALYYEHGEIVLVVERPHADEDAQAAVLGPLVVSGYALSPATVGGVEVEVDGHVRLSAAQSRRPDVRLAFLDLAPRPQLLAGFKATFEGDGWATGTLALTVTARDGDGRGATVRRAVRWAPDRDRLLHGLYAGRPLLWWSLPSAGERLRSGSSRWCANKRGRPTAAGGRGRRRRGLAAGLTIASPDSRRWIPPLRGTEVFAYNAILDVRDPGPQRPPCP